MGALGIVALAVVSMALGAGEKPNDQRGRAVASKHRGQVDAGAGGAGTRLRLWWRQPGRREAELSARWRRGGKAILEGRLTGRSGRPLGGAPVSVLAADAAQPEQGKRTVGELRSDREGRLRAAIALDRGAGEKLVSLSYLASPRDAVPSASAQAKLRVHAPVSVELGQRRVRVGQTLRLRGRSVPGAAVELGLSQPGDVRWRTLTTARAERDGGWRVTVRLPRSAPGGRYRFRARVRASKQGGYLAADSPAVAVEVR
ncbi:MAG: hypothetical protein M3370_12200 [Actinomycetota bacterium]|nr:hypothetical protein [Actinomycetota bacterium]